MAVPDAIARAYDPERFRADVHRAIDAIADQLASWHARETEVLPWRPPRSADHRLTGAAVVEVVDVEVIDRQHALARGLAAAPDFELGLAPASNLVCYRHRPAGQGTREALDAHNRAPRDRVALDGRFYIVGAELPAGYFLRSTRMNPLIEPADLDDLLGHLRGLCRS